MCLFALIIICCLVTIGNAYDNGPLSMERAPRGWSTWCTDDLCGLIDICTEKEIKKRADALVDSGLAELGYTWIFLDDCWASKERDNEGRLQPDAKQFPNGMKALSDYIHSKNLHLAVYTCIGTLTCKKKRPGSYGHFEIDAQTFADWEVDMVKCDNCNRPKDNPDDTTQKLFTDFSQALNATGHEMLFALCEWGEDSVWDWGPSISQMYRIQMDHLPFFNFPATAAGVGYGQGVNQIINWMADIRPVKFAKQGSWADPDFLMTMFDYLIETMPFIESRTEFTFWTLWSSPLLVATDVVDMSSEKKSILMNKEVLQIHEDPLFIAGDRIYNNSDGTQAWHKPLENGDVAIVLYNADNNQKKQPLDVCITFSDVGFNSNDKLYLRDVWANKNINEDEAISESYTAKVGHHDTLFLRVSKEPFSTIKTTNLQGTTCNDMEDEYTCLETKISITGEACAFCTNNNRCMTESAAKASNQECKYQSEPQPEN
jgi:alpha-galactosidase